MVAFNAGSQQSISEPGDGPVVIKVVVNMLFCMIGSTGTALLYHRLVVNPHGNGWDTENGLNGSLIGMVFQKNKSFASPFFLLFALLRW